MNFENLEQGLGKKIENIENKNGSLYNLKELEEEIEKKGKMEGEEEGMGLILYKIRKLNEKILLDLNIKLEKLKEDSEEYKKIKSFISEIRDRQSELEGKKKPANSLDEESTSPSQSE